MPASPASNSVPLLVAVLATAPLGGEGASVAATFMLRAYPRRNAPKRSAFGR